MDKITFKVTKEEGGFYRLTWDNSQTRNDQGYYRIITMDQARRIIDQAAQHNACITVSCYGGYAKGFRRRKDAVSLAEFIKQAYRDGVMEEPTRKRHSQGGA